MTRIMRGLRSGMREGGQPIADVTGYCQYHKAIRGSLAERVHIMPQINESLATEILCAISEFSDPINELSYILRRIQDAEMRKRLLRNLGDIMGLLENGIAFEARRAIREAE